MLEQEILSDVLQSEWLRNAMRAALAVDPVRAANDAELLACVLRERAARAVEISEIVSVDVTQPQRSTERAVELPLAILQTAGF